MLRGKTVNVIGGNYAIERIFTAEGANVIESLDKADIVVWTGGADVNPELYHENKHPKTHSDHARDRFEQACWFRAQKQSKFCVGICRGGQFLNVMNGGALWQDVDNHALGSATHPMYYRLSALKGSETTIFQVTSTHHQQMIPNARRNVQKEIWGFAGRSTVKESGLIDSHGKRVVYHPSPKHSSDAEIIWYPETKSLCFQPHPEYQSMSTREVFFLCVERALACAV